MHYAASQAKLLNVVKPCITFDQPLWQKKVEICRSSELDVFCRLGGFHMLLSFIGSIGSAMAGSGLEEVLKQCYVMGQTLSRAVQIVPCSCCTGGVAVEASAS